MGLLWSVSDLFDSGGMFRSGNSPGNQTKSGNGKGAVFSDQHPAWTSKAGSSFNA
jgi:hypothetical protein